MAETHSPELTEALDLLEQGKVDLAIGALQRCIRANPESFQAHARLGQAYEKKRNEGAQFLRLAERELSEALRLAPPEPGPHDLLCRLAMALGRTERVKEEYRAGGRFKDLPFARECLMTLDGPGPSGPGFMSALGAALAGRRRLIAVLALALTAFFIYRGWSGRPAGKARVGSGGTGAGSPAASFTLPDLSGAAVSLESFRGKKGVLLDFWATWCPPCRASLPAIAGLKQKYADKVEVLSLNQGETVNKVTGFLSSQGLNLRVLLDSEGAVARAYGVRGIPTFVVIDREGVIKGVLVGWGGSSSEGELTALLSSL
jgi:thiol-disulfide isomerase/thioredoxin